MFQVNASLLHELRMVLQHASKLLQRSGKKERGSSLLCISCLRISPTFETPAITISKGNAVCGQHLLS